MSRPFFHRWLDHRREELAKLPDRRHGTNKSCAMADFGLSAFAVFFTQSPSFLAYQKAMREQRGCDNAQSLFGITPIPSDNPVRPMLDPVPPEALHPRFDRVLDAVRGAGMLEDFRGVHRSTLIALDGTGYRSSAKIHGPCCSHLTPEKGPRIYFHTALTPVVVAPGRSEVFALRPEFIVPQGGHEKQDCEIAAAKRWLTTNFALHRHHGPITLPGEDLYAHQPFCRQVLLHDGHFLFTAKPTSRLALYRWIERLEPGPDLRTLRERVRHKAQTHTDTYRWTNHVPLAAVLTSLNLLAFLLHTALGWLDEPYRLVRARLSPRPTFFDDLRALTLYLHFPSWRGLPRFMMRGLELGPYAKKA
jgi:hypothetical protein